MSKKRLKSDAVTHWVPRDRDEVNEAIAEMGRHQRERERIKADMNDRMAEIKAEHDAAAKPLGERIAELHRGVHLWCEANRAKLTQDGRVKFHEFATGVVKWRITPFSVALTRVNEVLAWLKGSGKTEYIRNTETVDKEALLADREAIGNSIPGVAFKQKEEFSVQPHESNIEEVQS